mgnify:CR=1 FL=1
MLERIQAKLGAAECPEQKRLAEAAAGFEALLLAQLLKAMREERGWMGTGEDQASASMLEIAEEHLAQVLARAGGLGLRELVLRGLSASGCDSKAGS